MNLLRVTNTRTPGNQVEWVDENGKIYDCIFTLKEDAPIKNKMADLFERNIWDEKECYRYKLLMKECSEIHKLMFKKNSKWARDTDQ